MKWRESTYCRYELFSCGGRFNQFNRLNFKVRLWQLLQAFSHCMGRMGQDTVHNSDNTLEKVERMITLKMLYYDVIIQCDVINWVESIFIACPWGTFCLPSEHIIIRIKSRESSALWPITTPPYHEKARSTLPLLIPPIYATLTSPQYYMANER